MGLAYDLFDKIRMPDALRFSASVAFPHFSLPIPVAYPSCNCSPMRPISWNPSQDSSLGSS